MPTDLARVAAGLIVTAFCLAAAPAQAPDPIAGIEPGSWRLRELSGGETVTMCVADPHQLLQIRHAGAACERTTLDGDGSRATVRYVCAGTGYGRTSVVVETRQLVRIRTQGIKEGAPFDFEYEARRTGACRTGA
jgi:hypothetical protein